MKLIEAKELQDSDRSIPDIAPESLHIGPVSARSWFVEEMVGLVLQAAHRPVSGRAKNLLIGGREE